MNFETMYKENKKEYLKQISQIPNSEVDISYLNKVLDKEYNKNKNYNDFKQDILNFIVSLNKISDPFRINIFISRYMLKTKKDRKQLINYFKNNNIVSLKISYIDLSSRYLTTSYL